MIDEARLIAVDARVDHDPGIDREEECVAIGRILALVAGIRLLVAHALAQVLDHGRAFANLAQRKDPVAVNRGVTDFDFAAAARHRGISNTRGNGNGGQTAIGALIAAWWR